MRRILTYQAALLGVAGILRGWGSRASPVAPFGAARALAVVLRHAEMPRRIHHDPKTRRWTLPPLLSEKGPRNREASESRDLRHTHGGREA
jgi:hypothetical protein